jgi:hypothetical protein
MKSPKKGEIERENRLLREGLEEIYDHVADLLDLEEDDPDDSDREAEGDSSAR